MGTSPFEGISPVAGKLLPPPPPKVRETPTAVSRGLPGLILMDGISVEFRRYVPKLPANQIL
jgi:hypothetical protein